MKIAKLIFCACPAIIASLLLVAQPSHAAEISSHSATPIIQVSSAPQLSAPALHVTANFDRTSNPIQDQVGCSCSQCLQSAQLLQGKLPTFGS